MFFPSFGDARRYRALGEACAAALSAGDGSAWNACYDPIRPLGVVGYHTVPYLLLGDPVDRSYFFLLLNLLWLGLAMTLLRSVAVRELPGESRTVVTVVVFLALLLNLFPHVPMTLADLPALALFIAAIHQGTRVLRGERKAYFFAGLLVAAAALLKQTYLAHGFFLGCLILLFDPARSSIRDRTVAAAKFAIGASPVFVQVAWVYFHVGELWFFERRAMLAFAHSPKMPNLEASFTALPTTRAFMVKVASDVSYPTFLVLKMFRALFGFEWAVYGGYVKHSREWIVSIGTVAGAWLLVSAYLAMTIFTVVRGTRALRLLNGLTLAMTLFLAVSAHVELRYYILQRVVMWCTLAFWISVLVGALRRRERAA